MKKLFSSLAVFAFCLLVASCGASKDENVDPKEPTGFEAIKISLQNKEWDKVDSLANIMYVNRGNCDAKELANVSLVYFILAEQTDDIKAPKQLEYINRAIEMSDAAETADADDAKSVYEKAGKDIEGLKKKYTEKMSDYEKAAGKNGNVVIKIN